MDLRGKKALLVGSSFSAVPMFFALKRHGLHVSVCGNVPGDPCHQYADASFYIDYSSPDALRHAVEEGAFDYLVPTCNDYSYMSCAQIAERHAFPGIDVYETALALHTKDEFRKVTSSLGLPIPKFISVTQWKLGNGHDLRFPLLVKPTDSFSGRGMTKVLREADLEPAIAAAIESSRIGEAILEEFVEGSLHSHSAFIQGQRVERDFFVDEFCTIYPYQVNCSNHPSWLPESVRTGMRTVINRLAEALALEDGLLHTQFICKGDEFWVIECMRRCPGDLYGTLVELSTGADYADLFVRPFLGLKLPSAVQAGAGTKYVGRHTISRKEALVGLSFSHRIPSQKVDVFPLKTSGEKMETAPFDKFAILFAEFESREGMLSTTPLFDSLIDIRVPEWGVD
jgi:formate-dependent phosphoribosylglycinamide formyltransferase (GAR transformylase)